ncbi:MAG TPA: tetratricopeptide repeat protein [Longimicrobiales bacterium]|nr:tetratricopeptide repeat protein [Longimicrobiales bacterium]
MGTDAQDQAVESTTVFARLKRRKLVQWTAAYVTAAAALFGTLQSVGEVFAWPAGLLRAVVFLLLAGLLWTVVLAWYHGDRGRQRVTAGEVAFLAIGGLLGVAGAAHSLTAAGTTEPGPADAAPSLVVLPFTDTSPGRDQQYLGEGLAEELRRALSRLVGVPVVRGPSDPAKDGSAEGLTSRPGAALNVLDGSVQRVADRVRITARLTDGTGREAWSDRYEVGAAELFAVEDRIAAAVAARVGLRGAASRLAGPARFSTTDPLAHDHYLRGEHALKQRTPASVIQAIAEYRAASALDHGMTVALAREAYAYALFLDWGWTYPGLSPGELLERARELGRQVLARDSLSPEGWLAHAYLLELGGSGGLADAADAFGRAVALDPTNPEAQHQYGQTLMALGRFAEAKAAYHAALAVEPERPLTLVPLAAVALREGDVEGARRWADSAVALARDAPYPWASRSQLRLGLGDTAGARADAEEALRIDPSYELPARSALAAALAALGQETRAQEELARARRAMVHPQRPSTTEAYYLGTALLRMGRRSEALDVVEAARPRSGWLWFYLQSPAFDAVRTDERFRRIVEAADPRHAGA